MRRAADTDREKAREMGGGLGSPEEAQRAHKHTLWTIKENPGDLELVISRATTSVLHLFVVKQMTNTV